MYDFDLETGTIENRRTFLDVPRKTALGPAPRP